jgi:hypothetical protein
MYIYIYHQSFDSIACEFPCWSRLENLPRIFNASEDVSEVYLRTRDVYQSPGVIEVA